MRWTTYSRERGDSCDISLSVREGVGAGLAGGDVELDGLVSAEIAVGTVSDADSEKYYAGSGVAGDSAAVCAQGSAMTARVVG